jgi:sensor domain CHASE-containing protein
MTLAAVELLDTLASQGPVAAVLAFGMVWLASRLKESEQKADKRIDDMEAKHDQRIDAVERRAAACEEDRARLWGKLAELFEK